MSLTDQLHSLNRDQLQEVLTKASFLLNASGDIDNKALDSASPAYLVHQELQKVLAGKGLSCLPPLSSLVKMRGGSKFPAAAQAIYSYARELQPKNKPQVVGAIGFLCSLVIKRMIRQRIPFRLGIFVAELAQVANVVDEQFPGYRASGLLPALLKQAL